MVIKKYLVSIEYQGVDDVKQRDVGILLADVLKYATNDGKLGEIKNLSLTLVDSQGVQV